MDCNRPDSSVQGIFQARILEWVVISLFEGSSQPKDWTWVSCIEGGFFTTAAAAAAKSLQSCPTLCDPTDGSPPGSPIGGILQARTLECVAISFSNAWKWKVKVKLLSHVRLFSDPMDYSLPSSSVHGIFQARVLEWDAIASSTREVQIYWVFNKCLYNEWMTVSWHDGYLQNLYMVKT